MASKAEKRRQEIMNMLKMEGTLYVGETAKLFKVTNETIRADFDFLKEQYGLARVHGGIMKEKHEMYGQQYIYQERNTVNVEAKKQICFKAIDLVEDGNCIYIDGGSTVSYLLNFMNKKRGITLVTPSIALLMKYMLNDYDKTFNENQNKLIFLGGHVHANLSTTYGTFFDQMVQDFHFDRMFLSVDAIDLSSGCTNADDTAYAVAKTVMKRSYKKILLIDASKFGFTANYQVLNWQDIDYLITEAELNEEWKKLLRQQNIQYLKS